MTHLSANQLGSHTVTHPADDNDKPPHLPEVWASHTEQKKAKSTGQEIRTVFLLETPEARKGIRVQGWFHSLLWTSAKGCPRGRTLRIRVLVCMLVTHQLRSL